VVFLPGLREACLRSDVEGIVTTGSSFRHGLGLVELIASLKAACTA
jgi:hypothetical protein